MLAASRGKVKVAQLTSDMVGLVSQDVTLADGSVQSVLVPQVYVRVQPGDLDGTGALLAGADVNINLTGDATNSGTIAGRNLLQINAQSIQNLGGQMSADTLALAAKEDINNIGGLMRA
jgi:filamentous hemagglutinin